MVKGVKSRVAFHYLVPSFHFPKRTKLKQFIMNLLKKEGRQLDHINYIFCNDEEILRVNNQYLNHNFYTDIITFELSLKDRPVLADIYISIDRVKDNAHTYETGFNHELLRVIFHGALHLCGYKDKSRNDISIMRTKEEEYLNKYVPRGINR
ncbi:MAG: rRNA maturation RNase YbeY [Candidatus Dadabacteria bacterium]